ncbi:zinc finger protein 726-like [Belonocnema kinseyi]|uniref:zinc finger protein 726-like n=1 Tax=Belonocnema kinseyi TaxID=2817044 RepID=UPI00143D6A8A|nr:zinc finger protein 726-like [Belonocnema kinseyi]
MLPHRKTSTASRKVYAHIQIKSEPKKLTGILDGGQYFYPTIDFPSSNNNAKTLIDYDYDETLEIKEESIDDQKTTDKSSHQTDESKFGAIYMNEGNILPSENKQPIKKMKMMQESRHKSGWKYKCEKCARTYSQINSLKYHVKYECEVTPGFECKFCGKLFTRKYGRSLHMRVVHLKTNTQSSQARHNCDKCSRSYKWPHGLNRHKRLEHSASKPQFICDNCGYKTNRKSTLSTHVTSRHLQIYRARVSRRNLQEYYMVDNIFIKIVAFLLATINLVPSL